MSSRCMLRLFIVLLSTYIQSVNFSFAQDPGKKTVFDSTYYYIATTLSAKNMDEAIISARSLLNTAEDSVQRVRGLMLLATLNERTGRHADALKFAIEGEKLAEKIGDKQWQIRISGFLSTTFRELGLMTEGKKYIAIAEKHNNDPGGSPLFEIFIHQEKAYYEIESRNYHSALAEVNKAIGLFENSPPGKGHNIIRATCHQIAGLCYMNIHNLPQADSSLMKSLAILGNEESELKGFIYQNLGALRLKQQKYDEAIRYLEMALSYTASSKNFNLQLDTYKSLEAYYSVKNDTKSAKKFQSMYTNLIETRAAGTKKVSNELIEKLGYELEMKTAKNYILYFICGALLLAILFSVIYFTNSRRAERKKYLDYIAKLKLQNIVMPANGNMGHSGIASLPEESAAYPEEMPGAASESSKKDGLSIPKETEERVLKDLSGLERQVFYLNNDVNLSYLSAALKINSKYLSSIINKHKGKDFNNYINELRINYIIEKLQTDTRYLEYKIAYLSQECGFSTHSKFTTAFKNITGISPSAFINNIKKDHNG